VSAADLAPFAWELAQVMAQTEPAEALGAFHSAVLRSGSMRVEIRRLPSAAGPARILVVGGADRGRPGLARLQIERMAARLSGA
jgi:predicted regulator of Ras-like GTPase activity (Roadblock/LC7/MglB family)